MEPDGFSCSICPAWVAKPADPRFGFCQATIPTIPGGWPLTACDTFCLDGADAADWQRERLMEEWIWVRVEDCEGVRDAD